MKLSPEPRWLRRRQLINSSIPAEAWSWLVDPASLTARLKRACRGRFSVEVLDQGYRRPERCEVSRLGLKRGTRALVREVILRCDGAPWVFARTVIPAATLCGRQRRLAHLGDRPLGAVLFADPSMERSEVEIAHIKPAHRLFSHATASLPQPPEAIWGRRSLFRVGGKPLLVSEIFLPALYRR